MDLLLYDLLCISIVCSLPFGIDSLEAFVLGLALLLPILVAWRVRSFLRTLPHETRRNTLGVDTRNFSEFFDESRRTKNTLFSIKSQELRRTCPIALLLMRIYVILLIPAACLYILLATVAMSNHYSAHVPLTESFFFFILLSTALTFFWGLVRFNMYLYSYLGMLGLYCIFFDFLKDGTLSLFDYISFFVLAEFIVAWRVHVCLRRFQEKSENNEKNSRYLYGYLV